MAAESLPDAWRMAVRYCPHCSASGVRDDGRECLDCDGTGNLFGAYVRAAYRLGQADALSKLRAVADAAQYGLESAVSDGDDMRALLGRLGL